MKKTLILNLIMLLTITSLRSQVNLQIDSTSKWIQNEVYYTYSEPTYKGFNYSLSINGDTIINDTTYLKMYLDGKHHWYSHGGWSGTMDIYQYYGAVLSDLKKVFMIFPDSLDRTLLYNYNYEIGDTISSYVGENYIIQNIDTLYNGRKRYTTNLYNWGDDSFLTIVEGIGSNWGFIAYRSILFTRSWFDVYELNLGCYYQYDTIQYTYNEDVCNYFIVDISQNNVNGFSIYPNPVKSILRIDLMDITIGCVIIYNTYGILQLIDTSGSKEIDVSNLKPGMYFIRVNNEYTFKVIKA